MKIEHVEGKNAGKIMLYTLSTCGWCKKTKKFFNDNKMAYSYIDVDTLNDDDRKKIEDEIMKFNPERTFPTIVKDNRICVVGFDPDEIKEKIFK